MSKNVGIIIGSLREGSYTRQIADNIIPMLPEGYTAKEIAVGDLDLYNEDLETDTPPESWTKFRNEMKDIDAVLFFTPEYNRTVPATIVNAIDVGSRPYGSSIWDGKPAAIVSASPGAVSGFGANHHLRQSLVFVNMPTLAQPEVYLASVHEMLDDQGKIHNESTLQFLQTFVTAFVDHVETNTKA